MTDLNLDNLETYAESCRLLATERLVRFKSLDEIALAETELNAYPRLDVLRDAESVIVLEEQSDLSDVGRKAVLDGLVLWEHTAAGEATRLGLGPKFFITPEILQRKYEDDSGRAYAEKDFLPLNLGLRHLYQLVFEIKALAREAGLDPAVVMKRQKMLIVVGEAMEYFLASLADILGHLWPPNNIWFMVQPSFHGLNRLSDDQWHYDFASSRRLHNHGQMAMQKTMDRQIFFIDDNGHRQYFGRSDFFSELEAFSDLVSYNIEDLDYLTRALDFMTLGLAVDKGRQGYGMMMEITSNNPDRPIKGGLCAYDPALGRDVVIESFRLRDYPPSAIKYLNKNFNHYLNPVEVMKSLKVNGLFMPVTVKDGRLYYMPVQGDLNFLARTCFFTRSEVKAINSLKSPADIPFALKAMKIQEDQPGFRNMAEL